MRYSGAAAFDAERHTRRSGVAASVLSLRMGDLGRVEECTLDCRGYSRRPAETPPAEVGCYHCSAKNERIRELEKKIARLETAATPRCDIPAQ